jgi:uncharacterized membrane protein
MKALDKLRNSLDLDEKKGYAIAVMVVLVFAATLTAGYFVYLAFRGPPEPYTTIYVLSADKTLDLPETVVIGQNSTFDVWVTAENHMGETYLFEIRLKMVEDSNIEFPVDADPERVYSMTIGNDEKSEQLANVSIENVGRYMVVFELWRYAEPSVAEYTGNSCVLNIEAISEP